MPRGITQLLAWTSFFCSHLLLAAKLPSSSPLATVPMHFKLGDKKEAGANEAWTLNPSFQRDLKRYLLRRGNPIASIVVADSKSGAILAMVQGKSPKKWGGKTHSALHQGFPAASLFKTVTSVAVLELRGLNPRTDFGFRGGCQNVSPRGVWLLEVAPKRHHKMNLNRAFALSCNGFFAKIAVEDLGLGPILQYAYRLGWEKKLPFDFTHQASPLRAPEPSVSGLVRVGRFAAGFGRVGMSAVHAAWLNLVIANEGEVKPLRLSKSSPVSAYQHARLMRPETSHKLLPMMNRTVQGGTASYAFRQRGYRHLRPLVYGKTGTLTGVSPAGTTTWFAGMYRRDQAELVVAAVVVNGSKWVIKGPHLAAEAFRLWDRVYRRERATNS